LPPFWQTWWFRTLVVLLIIAIIVAVFISRTRQLEMKKQELTKLVEERTLELRESNALLEERQKEILSQKEVLEVQADKLKILNSTKDKFFSIIGHDLINPISGINSLTSILKTNEIAKKSKEGIKIINLIADSSKNVFFLLKNLLTWSQSQSEGLKADSLNLDLFKIVEESIQLLQVNIEGKHIQIINEVKSNTIIYADLNMITTVVRNLLSNAIKFTHNLGTVMIYSLESENSVQITIADTGIGMDEKTIDKLFRIDQQLTSKGTAGEGGTGLGLIICKEFVEKNNGSISVESSPGQGSKFMVALPKGNGAVADIQELAQPIDEGNNQLNNEEQYNSLEKFEEDEVNLFLQSIKKEERIILVIEDLPEIRFNIKKSLEPYFIVEVAEDGKAGLQKANEILPDLIISDIVMPEMNGFELCTILKSDINTSHIPIILLTSRSSDNSQLTGISIGADDYIIKPFKTQFLLARVKNLIVQRNRLREKFSQEFIIGPNNVMVSNSEEDFLATAIEVIERHIDESEFSVFEFCKELGMGQTQLNRKLKALTGHQTVGFIRYIRLKRAAQYLTNSEMNVNEIATIVGFNNMSYFSKSFQKQFGMLPKQYSLKYKA
jgi:signal transduction histidine kinase/DNA-binding response OmpR family regulator